MHSSNSIGQQHVAFEIASTKKKLHKRLKYIFICKEKKYDACSKWAKGQEVEDYQNKNLCIKVPS